MTVPGRKAILVAAVLAALAGCDAQEVPPGISSFTPGSVHVETLDALGDAMFDSRVPIAPDLVQSIVDVASGEVTLKLRLSPGTFSSAATRFSVDLDLDQNASTGSSGFEYYIFIFTAGGRGADIARAAGSSYTVVGTVPLSLLGNDNGRFNYVIRAYQEPALPVVFDVMPNSGVVTVE